MRKNQEHLRNNDFRKVDLVNLKRKNGRDLKFSPSSYSDDLIIKPDANYIDSF